MGTIVGFTVLFGLSEKDLKCAIMTQHRALDHFKHLDHQSIEVGESRLEIWGHKDLMDRVQLLPDGAVLVLIGSPLLRGE